jgi:ferredoxin
MHVMVDREVCFRHARCFAHCPEVFGLDTEGYSPEPRKKSERLLSRA